jgi:hypothetical protein
VSPTIHILEIHNSGAHSTTIAGMLNRQLCKNL